MTIDEFKDAVLIRRDFDFSYNGQRYIINASQGPDGELKISFGEEYIVPKKYDSFTHLMAEAKIGFRLLREIIVDL